MVILAVFMDPILYGIGARTEGSMATTEAYLRWTVIIGGIPTVSALMMGHLLRAEGNTKKASQGMILGGLANIVLDYIFVSLLGMGAEGAGIATFIANVVSLAYMLSVVLRNKNTVIVLNPLMFRIIGTMVKQIIYIGLPAAMIIILGSTANIVLTNQMSAYGDTSIAAFGIVQKFGTIAIQITVGLTQGIMPLLGYHYGAGNMSKVKEINRWSFGILAVYALACVAVIEIFTKPLVMVFMTEPETVAKAVAFAKVWILCAPGMCFTNLFCSIFQAMGKGLESLTLSVVRQGLILIPLLLVLNNLFGEMGLVCSQPAADNITLIIGTILYIRVLKKYNI
jgi:Na+-driven multidrug efflux pump